MAGVKKSRHLQILGVAKGALADFGGTVEIDATDSETKRKIFREMAEIIKLKTRCHIDTAKRNLAKAMRQDRFRRMQEKDNGASWGGQRPNQTGRPRKEN